MSELGHPLDFSLKKQQSPPLTPPYMSVISTTTADRHGDADNVVDSPASPTSTTAVAVTGGMMSPSDSFHMAATELLRRAMSFGSAAALLGTPTTAPQLNPMSSSLLAFAAGDTTSSLLPTTSLALSALHRRRRRPSDTGSKSADATPEKKQRFTDEIGVVKDDQYWERRRKNNEAAKRSRDSRKVKEDQIAMRAALLEQENLKLRAQVGVLKAEMTRLHCLLFNQVQT